MTMLFPSNAIPIRPPLDVKKALLLLDFQNDFVEADGKLPVPNISKFLPNLAILANKFRSEGSVIWVRTVYSQPRLIASLETGLPRLILEQHLGDGEKKSKRQSLISHDPQAFLDRSYPSDAVRPCISDTAGAQSHSALATAVDPKLDLHLVKSDYSAFSETDLLLQLRTRLITHLYVCGSLSNISVYATVLDAVRHGLEVTLVEDCLGFLTPKCHDEAVRQMADSMGASGTDYQELMDDLSGLLGDVIHEEDFTSHFQVSLAPVIGPADKKRVSPLQRDQRVEDWIADSSSSKRRQPAIETQGSPSKSSDEQASVSNESPPRTKTSKVSSGQATPEPNPLRKRSTSDLEGVEEGSASKTLLRSTSRRESPRNDGARRKQRNKPRLRNARSSQESSTRPPTSPKSSQSESTSEIPDKPALTMFSDSGSSEAPSRASSKVPEATLPQQKLMKVKKSQIASALPDVIGAGDCQLINDVLPAIEADAFFELLQQSLLWQKMYHRSGEVPRLVAVQGDISEDGNEVPIYRHPADESPGLRRFDKNVDALRLIAEKHVGHPLNHALIQWYRSGEDNISEHSDKTLDIVRNSIIVNMSLGAQRTMTLRTKKQPLPKSIGPEVCDQTPNTVEDTSRILSRTTQRIPLPHGSLFLLGQATNQRYLHSIRADKRPITEKSPAELAFNSERISLTFRHIGTFINTQDKTIWGQGATGKTRQDAHPILTGQEAEREGAQMIRAFGVENHTNQGWTWHNWYGRGFDVVDFDGHEVTT